MSVVELQKKYEAVTSPHELLEALVNDEFSGEVAAFSSFGAYSALLLSIVAEVNPNTPILFLETGKHFKETLDYVDNIERLLGLKNLIRLTPPKDLLEAHDPEGVLWYSNVDKCCGIRKVTPLNRHLDEANYKAVITGRRRYQTSDRADLKLIEEDENNRIRVNPLGFWDKDTIIEEFNKRNLPQHPLVEKGYLSIGCEPCTRVVKPGEDPRSGRWSHTQDKYEGQKTECGLHTDASAKDWSKDG